MNSLRIEVRFVSKTHHIYLRFGSYAKPDLGNSPLKYQISQHHEGKGGMVSWRFVKNDADT